MIDPETYLSGGVKIVKRLFREGEFNKAYQACQELLKVDPYHRKTLRWLRKIERAIKKNNLKKVKYDIKQTKYLWREGRFEELLAILNKLYLYAPRYRRLEQLIRRTKAKVSREKRAEREKFIEKAIRAIQKIYAEKRYEEVIQAAQELLSLDPLNEEGKKFLADARKEVIAQKLQMNERLIDSGNNEQILVLLESLLPIDPESKELHQLIQDTEARMAQKNELERKIHINTTLEKVKAHFEKQEYERVIELCHEILQIAPKNVVAKLYKKKAERIIKQEIEIASLKKMKENLPGLLSAFQEDPGAFVRI